MPPPDPPNVLLVVHGHRGRRHLGLYGYDRPTSPTIDELARPRHPLRSRPWRPPRGPCPPTRACSPDDGRTSSRPAGSHPLDGPHPTLAEFLGARGYATAGFVANTWYCASDSGLGRGFTVYRDYIFPELIAVPDRPSWSDAPERDRTVREFPGGRLDFAAAALRRRTTRDGLTPTARKQR